MRVKNYPVQFISLGPGDAELITLKGLRALQQAHFVFCPATTRRGGEQVSRSAEILRQLDIPAEKIRLFLLPMAMDGSAASTAYDALFEEVVMLHRQGYSIGVAAEGDVGVYCTVHYVLERLQQRGIQVEQVPGIPSFIASAARAHLHLVSHDERLIVLPGRAEAKELEMLVAMHHTVVVMKMSICAEEIRQFVLMHPQMEYHYLENTGCEQEFYSVDVATIAQRVYPYFSLLIIKHP